MNNKQGMKKVLFLLMLVSLESCIQNVMAQKLEKMNWFNEPEKWEIKNQTFSMVVPAKTDYWRISHYGFTVDDAPFYYGLYGGEFEVKVKIRGEYRTTFDQMGLMIRIDHKNWVKAGVEFVDGKQNVSTVVTHNTSDWSVVELEKAPQAIWMKAVRRRDALEVYYSFDDRNYKMIRTCWLEDNCPVMVGMMAASPDGNGFKAIFEDFKVTQLPDIRRLEWAEKQNKVQ